MARKKRESITPELTPLIDVVFLLLIFFLVSSVFRKEELALLLKLPVAEEGKGDDSLVKHITIELDDAKLAVNGVEVQFEELSSQLSSYDKSTLVNIRADEQVRYKRLIRLLDLLQINKLDNISLITQKN